MIMKENPARSMLSALLKALSYIFLAVVGYSYYFNNMQSIDPPSGINVNFSFFDFLLLAISLLILLREHRQLGKHVTEYTKHVNTKTRYFTCFLSLILALVLLFVSLPHLIAYEASWCFSISAIITFVVFSVHSLFPSRWVIRSTVPLQVRFFLYMNRIHMCYKERGTFRKNRYLKNIIATEAKCQRHPTLNLVLLSKVHQIGSSPLASIRNFKY